MSRAINHDTMRSENVLSVLQCIQENGPVYRKELKEMTGLSWGSVSFIVNRLLEDGLITQKQQSTKAKGRNPGKLEVSSHQYSIVGLDINQSGLTVVTMNLKSAVIDVICERICTPQREKILEQAFELLDSVKRREEGNRRKIIGIGVSMQGSVDAESGVSLYNPYFDHWDNVPIQRILHERYACKVIVEHTTECAAMYEMKFGMAKGVHNFIYVRMGVSLGISVIHEGAFLRGYNGNAGEFGHIIMKWDGEKCSCGKRGCLETVASERSILKHLGQRIAEGEKSVLSDMRMNDQGMTMDHVYRAYCLGDPLVREEIEQTTNYLALGLTTVINLLNPEMLVLGGDMIRYEGMFIERLRKQVESLAWAGSSKTILTSTTQDNTAAIGAGLLIVDDVFSSDLHLESTPAQGQPASFGLSI